MIVSVPHNHTTAMAPIGYYIDLIAFATQHEFNSFHDTRLQRIGFDSKRGAVLLSFTGRRSSGVE
jgi:LL-diaminopimelate aminotransferase